MGRLQDFVIKAWEAGGKIDLTGVGYGRIHWGDRKEVKTVPSSYYQLLAGIAHISDSKSALEIGTHWGGSTMAIKRGLDLNSKSAKLVTVDITSESDNYLTQFKDDNIIKIVGDANTSGIASQVRSNLDSADILYIDAAHTCVPTLASFAIYTTSLSAKICIFDDVALNQEMRQFWSYIENGFGEYCADISKFLPQARTKDVGFGVVVMPKFAESILQSTTP